MKRNILSDFENYIQRSSWEDIARMVKSYSFEFESENEETRIIKKKANLIRELLFNYLMDDERERILNKATFFRGIVKSSEFFENHMKHYPAKNPEFLFFLKALSKKLGRNSLVVFKVWERRECFEKLKEAGIE